MLLKETAEEYMEDGAAQIGAALAYYIVFSLTPLLVLLALIFGTLIGPEGRDELLDPVRETVGSEVAQTFQQFIEGGDQDAGDIIARVIWLAFLVWGASGAFAQLQNALNRIWEVQPAGGFSPWTFARNRLFSFLLVLFGASLLLGSFMANTILNVLIGRGGIVDELAFIITPAQLLISLGLLTLLFVVIFKILPDVVISWRDVAVGALFTAVLFVIGQYAVGLYISSATVSVSGIAGTLTVLLVWIYVSTQLLLIGAEFTEVWARRHGAYIRPNDNAEWSNPLRAEQEAEEAGVDLREENLPHRG
jgi:membrane protein